MSPSGWLPLKVEAVDPSSRASTPSSTVRSPERIFAVSLDRPRPSHKGVPAVTRPTPTSASTTASETTTARAAQGTGPTTWKVRSGCWLPTRSTWIATATAWAASRRLSPFEAWRCDPGLGIWGRSWRRLPGMEYGIPPLGAHSAAREIVRFPVWFGPWGCGRRFPCRWHWRALWSNLLVGLVFYLLGVLTPVLITSP